MSWFKLDDQGAFHAKVLAAGNEAYGAWCRAGQWSSAHLTEGRIPRSTALTLAKTRVWQRLIDAGLCDSLGDEGWQIHDYLEYNPSAEEALAKRASRAEAGRRGGSKKEANRLANGKQESSTRIAIASPVAKQNSTPFPFPFPFPSPIPSEKECEGEALRSPPKSRLRAPKAPTSAGALPRDWTVSEALTAWANDGGIITRDLKAMAEQFTDYWWQQDPARNKNAIKRDWDAAFRTWARRDIESGKVERRPPTRPSQALPVDAGKRADPAVVAAFLTRMDAAVARGSFFGNAPPNGIQAVPSVQDAPGIVFEAEPTPDGGSLSQAAKEVFLARLFPDDFGYPGPLPRTPAEIADAEAEIADAEAELEAVLGPQAVAR